METLTKGHTSTEEKVSSAVPLAVQPQQEEDSLNSLMSMFGQRSKNNPEFDRPEWTPHCDVRLQYCQLLYEYKFYVLLPYILYVIASGSFPQSPAFFS